MSIFPAPEAISLLKLQERLRNIVAADTFLQNQWVVCELSDVRPSGGHFYAELIEKDSAGTAVAKMRANIWRGQAIALQKKFGKGIWQLFTSGTEVKILGSVISHPLYGISFNIISIDPEYRRDSSKIQAEILAALKRDGILEDNKELPMPEAPQRIAVISAEGAAGYGDFMNQLTNNVYGLVFYPVLFKAVMQGASVSPTVCDALNKIEQKMDRYDCVVIIRGGGATSDLAGFDDLSLAQKVATFPLPIIVGIGHERDNTVLDFIANTRVKTPTAAAEWLIARAANILATVRDLAQQIANYTSKRLTGDRRYIDYLEEQIPHLARNNAEKARSRLSEITAALPLTVKNRLLTASRRLDSASRAIESAASSTITRAAARLDAFASTLPRDAGIVLKREENRLSHLAQAVEMLSPKNVLARGYSITRVDGHAVRSASELKSGAVLHTTLSDGVITSTLTDENP